MSNEDKNFGAGASVEIVDDGVDISAETLNRHADRQGDLGLPLMKSSARGDMMVSDPLTTYLARLSHIAPLPPDKQQELAERYKDENDNQAAKMLILTNLRLVVKIAREYQRRWTNLLDLIQEGNVGLAEAVTRYDPYRGVKFTSYAQYWIRAMILNYLMNHLHPVRIGSSRAGRKLFYNLKKARRELIRRGEEPTPALIAEYLDVDEAEVVRVAAQLDAPAVSMDAPAQGLERVSVGELMPSDDDDPEEIAAEREMNSQIGVAIKQFGEMLEDEREKAIWFGRMLSDEPRSLVELGEEYGVSKERIRQVEVQIRDKFKKYLLAELGEDVRINFLDSQ